MIVNSVLLCSLIAFACGQYQKPSKDAAILSEARYLAVNGQFGSQYKQEDGVEFKEESDGQGNRKGSYSYIDPNGVRRTVSYTAGKDGFRATGDHIPVPPVPVAPVAPPSQQSTTSAPSEQYNPDDDYDDSQSKNYQDQYNYQYVPQNQQPSFAQPQQPQYNPQSSFAQPQPQYNPSRYNPVQPPSYNPVQFQYQSPQISVPGFSQFSTESTHRLSSPGKLSLNRSPDGYSYTFNQV